MTFEKLMTRRPSKLPSFAAGMNLSFGNEMPELDLENIKDKKTSAPNNELNVNFIRLIYKNIIFEQYR